MAAADDRVLMSGSRSLPDDYPVIATGVAPRPDQTPGMLDDRKITVEPDFMAERIDCTTLVSYDEREIGFDLLVTVPLNMGADYVARSGLGDELNLVPVDRHTLLAKAYDNIFAQGDAQRHPTSKAGSVAHFAVDMFADNFVARATGRPMTGWFDGHSNCFFEPGDGKALLIDFNYDTEPLAGSDPVPTVGQFRLLEEAKPLRQASVPMDVLEPAAARSPDPPAGAHVHGWQTPPDIPAVSTMPVTTIADRNIHVDYEGFLTV